MEKNTSKSFNYYRVNFGGSKFKVREWLSTGKLAQGEKRKSENGWGDDKPILQISNLNRPIQQSNFRSFGLVFFTSSFFGEKTLCNQTLAWILEHQTGLFHIFLTQRTSTVHCHVIQNNNKKGTSRRSRGERERVTKNRIRRWKEQQLHSYWRSDKNHTPTKKKKKVVQIKIRTINFVHFVDVLLFMAALYNILRFSRHFHCPTQSVEASAYSCVFRFIVALIWTTIILYQHA